MSDAPPDYIDQMLAAIVGIEIPITRLLGKWKVSQNRLPADRDGVVEGLSTAESEDGREMARLVQEYKHQR